MRILFVWSSAQWSTFDVASGYRKALERLGHDVLDYRLYNRIIYHAKALGPVGENMDVVARQASENVLVQATYHNADLVFIVSGLSFHPNGVWLLKQHGYRVAVLLTESPYDDEPQARFANLCDYIFTNERISARRYGWHYLAHAIDPEVHRQTEPNPEHACDVLLVATGWKERGEFLEQVDWSGIDLRIYGFWNYLAEDSPLKRYVKGGCVDNAEMPERYASAKISLNLHRHYEGAESINPRAREIAACGCFQISDERRELSEVFGASVPVFSSPTELGRLIRRYLANNAERRWLADCQRRCVALGQTFDDRATEMIETIENEALANSRRLAFV